MFKGDWLRNRPLVLGFLLAAAYGLLVLHNHQNQSAYRYTGPYQQTANADYGRFLVETPAPQPQPERDEWREEQDLQAQRDMAGWASWMAVFAGFSVAVTAVGVWFVAETLKATRETLGEATKATKAAISSANAAQLTADITRDIGEKQVKAYLSITKVALSVDVNDYLRIYVTCKNAGQSPALKCCASAAFTIEDVDGGQVGPFYSRLYFGNVAPSLEPTEDGPHPLIQLPSAIWGEELEYIRSISVEVIAFAEDVFGKEVIASFTGFINYNEERRPDYSPTEPIRVNIAELLIDDVVDTHRRRLPWGADYASSAKDEYKTIIHRPPQGGGGGTA